MLPHDCASPILRLLRLALGLALVAASLATLPVRSSTQASAETPLADGRWQSFANGDRIQRLLREDDRLWAATDGGGVLRWDLGDGSHRQYLHPQDGLPANRVHDLVRDAQGRLWVATERGLARFDAEADRFEAVTPESSAEMPARIVTALLPASEGGLWVGFAQEWDPDAPHPITGAPGAFAEGGLARYLPDEDRWVDRFRARIVTDLQGSRYVSLASDNVTRLAYGSDGILWVGTRPYYVWDRSACGDECSPEDGAWIQAGGGLAAHRGEAWSRWTAADSSASCYPSHVTDLAADDEGRMWVGTIGRGLVLIRSGMSVQSCASGLAYYVRPRRTGLGIDGGLRGNTVWSVDRAPDGRIWIGHGDGTRTGTGIAILDHRGTFDDSSGCDCPSDDRWEYLDLDGLSGESDALVTSLLAGDAERVVIGTRDHRKGDGEGIRIYEPSSGRWVAFRSADDGLPSNHVVDLAISPVTGELWLSFAHRGAARFDGERWQSWRMFGAGPQVGSVTLGSREGFALIQVDIPDRASYDQRFPVQPANVRIADHPIVYTVQRYKDPNGSTPAYLELSPKLVQPVKQGDSIRLVDRGPASDAATQIGFTGDGAVWVGGRETVWLGENCPSERERNGECWQDGGVSRFDGSHWRIYDEVTSQIPDQEVQAVQVDPQGRVWIGTGDGGAEGDGIGVLDPTTGSWSIFDRGDMPAGNRMGSNGVADFSIDPQTGAIWTAHHAVVQYTQHLGGGFTRSYEGGGVSRWDGSRWRTWAKPAARLAAFGVGGDISAVLADRGNGRIWAGGWSPDDSFHWLLGYGINAAVNWCPIDTCENGDWQARIWPGDGLVADLELDADGRVWAATHRNGKGLVPARAGIKLYDGLDWHEVHAENSPLVDGEITALARDGESMWIGALADGVSRWSPALPPTPSPTRPPASATPLPSLEPSPTARATASPDPMPSASATPRGRCQPGRPCTVHLPVLQRQALCLDCTTPAPASATPRPGTPRPGTAQPSPTRTATASPSPRPSATVGASRTPAPSASPTLARTETPRPSATASATASPSVTPTPSLAPIGSWTVYDPGPLARLPKKTLYDVHGTAPNSVWMVGAEGTALFWDGSQLLVETLPAQSDLRRVHMLSERRGFIAGDEGTALEMRSGRWVRSNTNAVTDDWRALSVIDTVEGPRGWLLGAGRGNRLYFDGSTWNATSPDDRNTGHAYSGVAMIGATEATSIQSGGGGRIYDWDGERWWPGTSVGPMRDLHVPRPDLGVMGGDNGAVYRLGDGGEWTAMPRPVTRGAPIHSVHVLAEDRIYASAGQTALFAWDGESWRSQRIVGSSRDVYGLWVSQDGREGWAVGTDGLLLRYSAP